MGDLRARLAAAQLREAQKKVAAGGGDIGIQAARVYFWRAISMAARIKEAEVDAQALGNTKFLD